MLEPRSLLKRIANLETLAKRLRTRSRKGYLFVPADKDGNEAYDPLTAAAWENSTKDGSGIINLNTVFGVPTNARLVVVWARLNDDVAGTAFTLRAKSTTTNYPFGIVAQVGGVTTQEQGKVPIAADGTIYYAFSSAVTSLFLRVVGWYV